MKMTKTEYTALVSSGFYKKEVFKRVYVDEQGKRYIKESNEYKCIENTQCVNFMVKD